MALNYKPLWIQLPKKGLKKTDVIAMAGLTTNVMAQMGKDKPITFKNLEKICNAMEPAFRVEEYKEYPNTQVRKLTADKIQKYMSERYNMEVRV